MGRGGGFHLPLIFKSVVQNYIILRGNSRHSEKLLRRTVPVIVYGYVRTQYNNNMLSNSSSRLNVKKLISRDIKSYEKLIPSVILLMRKLVQNYTYNK